VSVPNITLQATLTYLRQILVRKVALKRQALHVLEHWVVLLSSQQCCSRRPRAVCAETNKSHSLWFQTFSGKSSSNDYIILPSASYVKGLNVLVHLQLGAKELSLPAQTDRMITHNTMLTSAQVAEHVCLRAVCRCRQLSTAAPTVGTDRTSIKLSKQAFAAESAATSMITTSHSAIWSLFCLIIEVQQAVQR
jgi:hypothetical protein